MIPGTTRTSVVKCCVAVLLSWILWLYFKPNLKENSINTTTGDSECWYEVKDERLKCRPQCDYGYFSLSGMTACHPWLRCQDIENDVKIVQEIGRGAVKLVFLGSWQGRQVVVNRLLQEEYLPDFQHGLQMLKQFQSSMKVVQLVGFCDGSNTFVTEYHHLQSANRFEDILQSDKYIKFSTLKTRFRLCMDYVKILFHLHNSPVGTRIMCDSNDIDKTLSQYLLSDNLRLVLNDVDALPEVNKSRGLKAKCGHHEIEGDFVAPEQLWPFDDCEFDDAEMPGYDEKTDIWKIPDVCNKFLGSVAGANSLKFHLFQIHTACKETSPENRPTSLTVYSEYEKVWNKFNMDHI